MINAFFIKKLDIFFANNQNKKKNKTMMFNDTKYKQPKSHSSSTIKSNAFRIKKFLTGIKFGG